MAGKSTGPDAEPPDPKVSIFGSLYAFDVFSQTVRQARRFAHSPECMKFLDDVRESAKHRRMILREGHPLWRAQIGNGTDVEVMSAPDDEDDVDPVTVEIEVSGPYPAERMTPDPKLVTDGRLNPRGIAFLYLSRDEATAIAEVRPWLGAPVSLGVFEVLRDSVVINCSTPKRLGLHFGIGADGRPIDPPESEWDEIVWGSISHAFAVPTDPHDSKLTYAPTQILAEVLREEGYDGILYQSAMRSKGQNVALFDLSSARLFSCALKRVHSIQYESKDSGRPYSLPRKTKTPPVKSAAGK